MKLGRRIFILAALFCKFIDCNVIPCENNEQKLRLNSAVERKKFVGQPEGQRPVEGTINIHTEAEVEKEVNVKADTERNTDAEVDVRADLIQDVNRKRCTQHHEPILGSKLRDGPNLNIVRRDAPMDTIRKRCENCRNSPKCKNHGLCDFCERICKLLIHPQTIDQTVPSNPHETSNHHIHSRFSNNQNDQSTLLGTPHHQFEEDDGLSEVDDRYYTVGSFGPGPVQSLLTKLLRLNNQSKLDRLVVLAKTVSTLKPHSLDKPVVIDTAHVFTLNDGTPSSVELELHPVDADKEDVLEFTRRLNRDLDAALEMKKQQLGKTIVRLSAKEIDDIIKKAIEADSAKSGHEERIGEANPPFDNNKEEVDGKKKEIYEDKPINYGGYYREDDSDEELHPTNRTVDLKSITTRNNGFNTDDNIDADNLRTLTNNLEDVVGATKPVESNEKAAEEQTADKLAQHSSSDEDSSKGSVENDKERHKGKKNKKHKKGGHKHKYYGGYRDNDDESNEELSTKSKERSNNDPPKQDQINYEAPNEQEHPLDHQYELTPALPNSYQPEQSLNQQDNYRSEETYYSDSSEEYIPESYNQENGYEDEQYHQHHEEEQPHEKISYQQSESYQQPFAAPQPHEYQESQPQKPEHQQVYQPQPEEQQQYKQQSVNRVYNHPAPPVQQGTYEPKKPQYNEEPKTLPTAAESTKQYPISQTHEPEEKTAYEQTDGEQQEIIIPGLNVDEDYIIGQAKNTNVQSEDQKSNNQLHRADSDNKTVEVINQRIDEIADESTERIARLDGIGEAIDGPLVGDNNLNQFRNRFNKSKVDDNPEPRGTEAALENEPGRIAAVKRPLLDSKHLVEKIVEPIIGMANIPSESKSPPFVDPKAMDHQFEVDKMMREKTNEQIGCKHKDDSSEEYYFPGYYRTPNNEGDQHQEKVGAGELVDTIASMDKKNIKQQHGHQENEDKLQITDETTKTDDAVGCKKKKDKDSEEEIIYVHPQYNSYGGYRENEEASDRKPQHNIIVKPNEETDEKIVGLEQPGPSGPFTDEPIDTLTPDDTVGCKKKKNDKESSEEYIYVYPQKPLYNEYGGYRDNIDGSERKKPLEKVREVLEGIVHPSANPIVTNKQEDVTDLPKAILPTLIEGFKQLRNHHNEEVAKINRAKIDLEAAVTSTTEATKDILIAPELNRPGSRQKNIIIPPQRFNDPRNQFIPPPPPRGPIEDNLAMLEAFHNHQNQHQQQQRFFPIVGAAQPPIDSQTPHQHEDMNFGQMIPADQMLGIENREVNEKTQMFFVGDGIKLPIHVKKQKDGTMHLSIDVGKLCQCNNVSCTDAVEGLANLVPTLEKLNHGTVELEVNEDSFNSALNNLKDMEEEMIGQQFSDKAKRSPQLVTRKSAEEELSVSGSGELVPVFDDEENDDISPIRKYYTGDLTNDLHNLKDNIQKYYENEDKFKEYMSEHKRNKGFFDEFIVKRVELLTNVLSWMKSIAVDYAKPYEDQQVNIINDKLYNVL